MTHRALVQLHSRSTTASSLPAWHTLVWHSRSLRNSARWRNRRWLRVIGKMMRRDQQ